MTHPDGCSSLKGSYITTHAQQHKELSWQRKRLDQHVLLNIPRDIRAMTECPEHRLQQSAFGVPGATKQMQCPESVQSNSRTLGDGTEEKGPSWPLTRQNPSSSMVG